MFVPEFPVEVVEVVQEVEQYFEDFQKSVLQLLPEEFQAVDALLRVPFDEILIWEQIRPGVRLFWKQLCQERLFLDENLFLEQLLSEETFLEKSCEEIYSLEKSCEEIYSESFYSVVI